jgi:hypothetical protein
MSVSIRLLAAALMLPLAAQPLALAHDPDEAHVHDAPAAFIPYAPSPVPDRVILNLTEDARTSMAVTWRTDTSVAHGYVEFALATHGPQFLEDVTRINAHTEMLTVHNENEPEISAHYHSAILTGLEPDTRYVYRVGDDVNWSEWYQFDTAGEEGEPFSFIYFGDAQNDLKSMWSRVVREAAATAPRADFMLHAGDLVNRHDADQEWGQWFYAGGFLHAQTPSVMTPGNHEYNRQSELSPQWRPGFTLPRNGPVGLSSVSETTYYVDYQDLRLISIDADHSLDFPEVADATAAWLDQILTDNPKRWTAIFLHYPFFSTKPNRDLQEQRDAYFPVLARHDVDIILQGHDHGYGRGQVENLGSGAINFDTDTGTMFVVSVSGPKMYDVDELPWADRVAEGVQLFQHIRIDGDTLSYEAYTATGALYDAFDLVKQPDGPNRLVNRIPEDMPQIWSPGDED